MRNVAILVQNLHNGGAERMAANLSIELARYDRVYLIVFDGSGAIYPYGGKLIDLKIPPLADGGAAAHVSNVIRRVRILRYLKKKLAIDCCISHMSGANVVNILSRRRDVVYSVYHSMPSNCEDGGSLHKALHRFIGRYSDGYICVSEAARQDMAEHFGVAENKLSCIYNFVDLEKIAGWKEEALSPVAESFFATHERVIVNMGRLIAMKGQKKLIRIFSRLRAADSSLGLLILGEGEERAALTALSEELNVASHVFMPGEIANPFPYLKRASVFVLCSDYEGLPMVLIEAAACGLPIVSCDVLSGPREILAPDTDVKSLAESVEYAQYGVLTPSCAGDADTESLSAALEQLMSAVSAVLYNDDIRQRYIKSAPACAERFSTERITAQWRALADRQG